jgi:hypothetical protein
MKNAYKFLGIAALALAIVFSMAACDNSTSSGGSGGGGSGSGKTIVIKDFFAPSLPVPVRLGVFPVGTTLTQALSLTTIVAGTTTGSMEWDSGTQLATFTADLYDLTTNKPWTGTGKYDIYLEVSMGGNKYYKAGSVNITSATTTISVTQVTS